MAFFCGVIVLTQRCLACCRTVRHGTVYKEKGAVLAKVCFLRTAERTKWETTKVGSARTHASLRT